MEREVRVYGPLAKFVGQRRFLAEISSAGEAVRMLLANFPGLERHMADQHYKVIVDGYDADLEELHYPASQTIKIVPVLGGAGGGVGKILAGAAIIAFAIVTAGAGVAGLGLGFSAGTAISIGTVGATLILGGARVECAGQLDWGEGSGEFVRVARRHARASLPVWELVRLRRRVSGRVSADVS